MSAAPRPAPGSQLGAPAAIWQPIGGFRVVEDDATKRIKGGGNGEARVRKQAVKEHIPKLGQWEARAPMGHGYHEQHPSPIPLTSISLHLSLSLSLKPTAPAAPARPCAQHRWPPWIGGWRLGWPRKQPTQTPGCAGSGTASRAGRSDEDVGRSAVQRVRAPGQSSNASTAAVAAQVHCQPVLHSQALTEVPAEPGSRPVVEAMGRPPAADV